MSRSSLALADRREQRAAIVGALHERRMSRTALGERFGVSSSLITRVVRSLVDEGVVYETGTQLPSNGRPAVQLEVTKSYGALIAVSYTANGMHARSYDLHNHMLREVRHDVDASGMSPQEIVESIANLASLTPRLLGVGVSIAGVVDAESGAVSAAPNLGWTDEVALFDMLHERLGVAITIDNDVNLMMAAESRMLTDANQQNAVYLYLGERGIGAGIMAGGKLVRGRHGGAGEIGLIPIGEQLDDVNFEERMSTTAIAARLEQSGTPITGSVIGALLARAASGDASAISLRADIIAGFAHAITIIAALLDPAVILFGGHASEFGDQERAEIAAIIAHRLPFLPQLECAQLDDDAVLEAARRRCWSRVLAGGL